jgi:hypothetical protein
VIRASRSRGATEPAELEALGFRPSQALLPALVVPIHDVTGQIMLHQIRPDRPRVTDAGRELKYEPPTGSRLCLDVHPAVRERLADPKVPLWITEGARKADAAESAGRCCIALLGVWGWRGTNEQDGKTALACWESIALNDREVFLAFDSDVMLRKSRLTKNRSSRPARRRARAPACRAQAARLRSPGTRARPPGPDRGCRRGPPAGGVRGRRQARRTAPPRRRSFPQWIETSSGASLADRLQIDR